MIADNTVDKDLKGLQTHVGNVDISEAVRYITAPRYKSKGKCIFTFVKDGVSFTYKCTPNEKDDFFFISVLCGPDNTRNYKYIGFINYTKSTPVYSYGKKSSKISQDAESVVFFQMVWDIISKIQYLEVKDGKNVITTNSNFACMFNNIPEAETYAKSAGLKDYIVYNIIEENEPFSIVQKKIIDNTLVMWHSSHCCRCGRVLTVEKSVKNGFGPICAGLYNQGK